MRIVDRKSFLELPAGTIYCKGEKWNFGSILIKEDTLANDWFYSDMAWPDTDGLGEAIELLEDSLANGSSFKCEGAITRDGCFDEHAVFLIFEKDDLRQFRSHIDAALSRT